MPDIMTIARQALGRVQSGPETPADHTLKDARAASKTIADRLLLLNDPAWTPKAATRAACFDRLETQIGEFARLCDTPDGYTDAAPDADPFADGALTGYRWMLSKLRAEETARAEGIASPAYLSLPDRLPHLAPLMADAIAGNLPSGSYVLPGGKATDDLNVSVIDLCIAASHPLGADAAALADLECLAFIHEKFDWHRIADEWEF